MCSLWLNFFSSFVFHGQPFFSLSSLRSLRLKIPSCLPDFLIKISQPHPSRLRLFASVQIPPSCILNLASRIFLSPHHHRARILKIAVPGIGWLIVSCVSFPKTTFPRFVQPEPFTAVFYTAIDTSAIGSVCGVKSMFLRRHPAALVKRRIHPQTVRRRG